jgi:hypothetical protein
MIVIARRHEQDPYLSVQKLAQSLLIYLTTVCPYLSDVLGLKCPRLGWHPHTLTIDQKAKPAQYAEATLGTVRRGSSRSRIHLPRSTAILRTVHILGPAMTFMLWMIAMRTRTVTQTWAVDMRMTPELMGNMSSQLHHEGD